MFDGNALPPSPAATYGVKLVSEALRVLYSLVFTDDATVSLVRRKSGPASCAHFAVSEWPFLLLGAMNRLDGNTFAM